MHKTLDESLKEIIPRTFWEQNKEPLKFEDEVIEAIKNYHQRAV